MTCSSRENGSGNCTNEGSMLPVDPFTALKVHFGMLLGVDDIDALATNPRGKIRLHNAWLHREGAVWGFGLQVEAGRSELSVSPGLGLDALGRELHLDVPICVNLGSWYEAHKSDPDFVVTVNGAQVSFDAHVVAKFKACLTRPVPAIADPCESAATDVAYSRVFETVEMLLCVNGASPKELPYHRLRLLFGLDEPRQDGGVIDPEDAAILARRDDIRENHSLDEQPRLYLEAFREYAALDTIAMAPAIGSDGARELSPETEPSELLLGEVRGVTLELGADGTWRLVDPQPVLVTKVRPSHVATAAIQELLCGPILGEGPQDAGGPRFDATSVVLVNNTVTLTSTSALAPASVRKESFAMSTYDDDDGWSPAEIDSVALDAAGTLVTIELAQAAGGDLLRLVAFGTGPAPILGSGPSRIPLAGALGGPSGSAVNGNDFIWMLKRS